MIEFLGTLTAIVGLACMFIGLWWSMCDRRNATAAMLMLIGLVCLIPTEVFSRDLGQWENSDPAIKQWYESLMQPDAPNASCCGPADAYWADEIHVRDGKTFATITDDRDDAPLKRPHIPNGTEIEVPNHKLKWDKGNPVGHSILFVSPSGFVWCYVQGTLS